MSDLKHKETFTVEQRATITALKSVDALSASPQYWETATFDSVMALLNSLGLKECDCCKQGGEVEFLDRLYPAESLVEVRKSIRLNGWLCTTCTKEAADV